MARYADNAFWDFSIEVYAGKSVSEACLALQDRHGLDINILLFCCFAASKARTLTREELGQIMTAVAPWRREVIGPLRQMRRWLTTQDCAPMDQANAIRSVIKMQELEAERIEQLMFLDIVFIGRGDPAPVLGVTNLKAYFAVQGITPDISDKAHLATILAGSFEDLLAAEAIRLI